jgi:hypothetical protein
MKQFMAHYFLITTNKTCNPEVFEEFDVRDVETVSVAYYFFFSYYTLSGYLYIEYIFEKN